MRIRHLVTLGAAALIMGSGATAAAVELGADAGGSGTIAQDDESDSLPEGEWFEIVLDDGSRILVDETVQSRLTADDGPTVSCEVTPSSLSALSETAPETPAAPDSTETEEGDGAASGEDASADVDVDGESDIGTPAGSGGAEGDVGVDVDGEFGDLPLDTDPTDLIAGVLDSADGLDGVLDVTGAVDGVIDDTDPTSGIIGDTDLTDQGGLDVDADDDGASVGLDGADGLVDVDAAGTETSVDDEGVDVDADDENGLEGVLSLVP